MATRDKLLDAAQQLIQSRGARGMSYEDLSLAVGIRKASVHYHFATKADLVSALVERYSEAFLQQVDGLLTGEGDGAHKLRAFVELFEAPLVQGEERSLCLCGMLASELATLDEVSAERVRAFYREGIARLGVVLELGLQDGSIAFKGQPMAMASLVFSLLEGALATARLEGGVGRFRSMADQLYQLVELR